MNTKTAPKLSAGNKDKPAGTMMKKEAIDIVRVDRRLYWVCSFLASLPCRASQLAWACTLRTGGSLCTVQECVHGQHQH